MKFPLLLIVSAALLLPRPMCGQTAAMKTVEKEGIRLNAPKDWTTGESQDPFIHVLTDQKNRFSVIVLREVKADMGVKDLQEYFEFKLEKIAAAWDSPRLGKNHSGLVNEANAMWAEGSANLIDPQGNIKIPSKVLFATVEGKDYYYLVLMSERIKGGSAPGSIFPEMLNSFKAP